MNNKKSYYFILLIVICGSLIGTSLGLLISYIVPDGVVKDFFLLSKLICCDPFYIDLSLINFTIGLNINVSVLSILGMFISWYFLRYFK